MNSMFTDIDLAALRARRGLKWSRYATADVIPAWVADMDFPIAPCIREAVTAAVEAGDLGYPPDDRRLSEAFSVWAERRWDWSPDPGLTIPLPDVVRGIRQCIDVLTDPGDAIVVTTPIYPPFLKTIAEMGREAIELPLTPDRRLDWSTLRFRRPAMVLLCNPHNPMGRVLSLTELEMVAGLGVAIVSDEIHADLVYADSPRHVPIATLDDEVRERTVTLVSASKAFNLAGLRCALMLPGSPDLAQRLAVGHEPIGTLGIVAAIAAWSDAGKRWLDECMEVLDANRRRIADWAATVGVGYQVPESTYLAWLDFRNHPQATENPSAWLVEQAKVALSIGTDFGALGAGYARLNFATSPAILTEILARIGTSLGH